MSDYADQFEKDFYPDAKVTHLGLDLLDDMWQELRDEFAINHWSDEEGLRYLLAAGLAAVRAERMNAELERNDADLRAEIDRLQRERMQIDGRYAVMKFRTYQFMQDAKALAAKLNACLVELEGLRRANENLRARLQGEGGA